MYHVAFLLLYRLVGSVYKKNRVYLNYDYELKGVRIMEDITIREFEFALINEFFTELERQGPGSPEETIRALSFISNLSSKAKIADLGCGTGAQTMVLAQNTKATITALDLYAGSIDKLNVTAEKLGLQNRVKGIVGSMDNLPFRNDEFDLIWSEGAIANIGFEKGLNHWKNFLKKDGYVVITYESWFTDERPAEIEKWWVDAVPEIGTIAHNISIMQKTGYIPVATFTLPESCWIDNYFIPQKARQEEFLEKHAGDKTVEDMIVFMRREAALYSKYKQYYGYVFYIGKKL
ncbi:class I SAM-dependent methyltransferase [Sporomusa sphaeroides]|uniref:class I SAM-dependent methyltransferase n=1 Tax=Sporomusa sphaeroides TaxID=47679 RepID=UPI002B6EF3B3|nr:class I SAM-dependent methyltransferase [Sporomusa sphaeroides]HML33214.1 class I SAM-dependent methyltransferase [Sporomusa sphaeroides]HML33232.1 class I SAM-dependent methyltransferase [Sporomusa sphaeroides]